MSLLANSNAIETGGYQISRSVRLRSSASAYFNRTLTTPTNNKIWTWSAWVKKGTLTSDMYLVAANGTTAYEFIKLSNSSADNFEYAYWNGSAYAYQIRSTLVLRDPSAWYHIVMQVDTTQATAANRVRIYVNNVEITSFSISSYPSQNTNTQINSAIATRIGAGFSGAYFDGYLTEINFIDGQALTPSSFGETNPVTGVWQPKKYAGTYGTNGFYLNFSDNSAATAAAIGKDYSGNGNNWTPNNISVTAGVTYDSMLDVPTQWADGGNGRGNYAVMNPLDAQGTATLSDANLTLASATTAHKNRKATFMLPSTGKWYWELTTASTCSSSVILGWGLQTTSAASDSQAGNANTWMAQNDANQDIFNQTTSVLSTGSAVAGGSIRQVAYDADTGKLWFGVNNSWYSSTDLTSGNPGAGTNQCMTLSAGDYFPAITCYNLTANANFGQRPFSYTPPTGFKALNTTHLSEPTVKNGAGYFAATLYTGNGSTQSITNTVNGVSFQPDLVWIKPRVAAGTSHVLTDAVRGVSKFLSSNTTGAESSLPGYQLTAFNSNGFTLVDNANGDYGVNGASGGTYSGTPPNYVGWQWKANGTGVSNTAGSITSTVSASTTAGFSVVTYTGTGANATVGHGLGVAPSMVIVKSRSNTSDWVAYHVGLPSAAYRIYLNYNLAQDSGAAAAATWNSTAPSSSVFSVGTNLNSNSSGWNFVAYCFAAIPGYSAFGSFVGNGSATNGPFVYCGFRPRFVFWKNASASGDWQMKDSSRSTYNVTSANLYANLSNAENSAGDVDFLSNGFKIRSAGSDVNGSTNTIIYAAFSEVGFKYALAR